MKTKSVITPFPGATFALPSLNGPGEHMGVYAANESMFDSAYYDQPLTNYLVGGWDQDPLEQLLEFFAPAVPVSRRFNYKTYDAAEDFLADDGDEDVRPINGEFREVREEGRGEVHAETLNKGFTICLDKDKLAADPAIERRELRKLMRRLKRNELRRAIALIDAAATGVTPTWDATADPDQYVRDQLTLAENSTGLRPNRAAYGSLAWDYRSAAHRAGDSAGAFASSRSTPAEVAAFLGVEGLSFSEARYRTAANTLANYLGAMVYLFSAASGLSEEDPSNIKRFVSDTSAGGRMAVYRDDQHVKIVKLTVEHYSLIKLTSALGIRKLTVSNS